MSKDTTPQPIDAEVGFPPASIASVPATSEELVAERGLTEELAGYDLSERPADDVGSQGDLEPESEDDLSERPADDVGDQGALEPPTPYADGA